MLTCAQVKSCDVGAIAILKPSSDGVVTLLNFMFTYGSKEIASLPK